MFLLWKRGRVTKQGKIEGNGAETDSGKHHTQANSILSIFSLW